MLQVTNYTKLEFRITLRVNLKGYSFQGNSSIKGKLNTNDYLIHLSEQVLNTIFVDLMKKATLT